VVGEAFPLGSFDEDLGVWEREELINPEDVVIENFPMLGSQQLKIVPPDYLKRLAQLKQPAKEYRLLEMNFPDLIPYLLRASTFRSRLFYCDRSVTSSITGMIMVRRSC
jgi:hypothetical protein